MTPDAFRKAGHRLIDLVADIRAGSDGRPVRATAAPGEIMGQLPAHPPEGAEKFDTVLDELEALLLPGLTDWQSPRFFGYFPANAHLAGVLGDLLSTGLGVIGLSWASSPALTEVETVVLDWMRQMLGLSEDWHGVIEDTASTATLLALICAREVATDFALARGGLQGEAAPLTVYMSQQAHSSVEKAALLAGFGRANLRVVAHDLAFAMRPDALAAAMAADRAADRRPCAIVATVGSTATTAIDPLEPIAAVARTEGAWLHVDAAMGGSAMILPECRALWNGIESADSLVINAHKWLGVPFDCSLYYVRSPQTLIRVMSTNPSFLQSAQDGQVRNYRDWGIPLGRRFRALKLWFLIRAEGIEGLQARLRRDRTNARRLAHMAKSAPDWTVLAPVPFQTVCLRHDPGGLDGAALDRHTLGWVEAVNASGQAYLTPATIDGRWMARVSIGALPTEWEHVEALWRLMREKAEAQATSKPR